MHTRLLGLLLIPLVASSAFALDSQLKPGMDKERDAMVARWKKVLDSGDQPAIVKALSEAREKSGVAFGMSDWPQAVAEHAKKSDAPLQNVLLNHLREHRNLISQSTRDWIKNLFKHDVLDPSGENVRGWATFGNDGVNAARDVLDAAAKAERWDEVNDLLDAVARVGNDRFLPLAALYLNNEKTAQTALSVFKAQAKDLSPDLRSPKLCRIWWFQTGKAAFENK